MWRTAGKASLRIESGCSRIGRKFVQRLCHVCHIDEVAIDMDIAGLQNTLGGRRREQAAAVLERARLSTDSPRARATTVAMCGRYAGSFRREAGFGCKSRGNR